MAEKRGQRVTVKAGDGLEGFNIGAIADIGKGKLRGVSFCGLNAQYHPIEEFYAAGLVDSHASVSKVVKAHIAQTHQGQHCGADALDGFFTRLGQDRMLCQERQGTKTIIRLQTMSRCISL